MTPDAQLRDRFSTAVDDTTVPPTLARDVLAGGRRRRRRRRTASAMLLATAVAVGGVLLRPDSGTRAVEGTVADGGAGTRAAGLAWARSLPSGPDPALPFFGAADALWSNGERFPVPEAVNRSMAPREVEGGWLVFLGEDYRTMRLAVLGRDGGITTLPAAPGGLENAEAVAVSADGTRVAYDGLLVTLPDLRATDLPHAPAGEESQGYSTGIRVIGFGEEGLLYEGAPFEKGVGAVWLLRPDGSSVEVPLPGTSHVPQGGGADAAVAYDYAEDGLDTCVTSWRLRDGAWEEQPNACLGRALGEALSVSPDGGWLLTDDVPDVWNLAEGRWDRVDMPEGIGPEQMLAQGGGAVWESEDSFLLPVADRWTGPATPEPPFDQVVQVVRCSLRSGRCERAGAEQSVRVAATMWDSTALRFVDP